jgi:ABC-type spermidine/putrescine transport system permease subunit II
VSRSGGVDRPRFLWVVTGLTLAFLFAPLVVVAVYSFNSSESLTSFDGASLRWYRTFFNDSDLLASLRLSLVIATVASIASVVLGTLVAVGIRRGSRKVGAPTNASVFLRVLTPETATGVALLLMFTQAGISLSTTTVIISHTVLCLAFVAVVVGSRLALLNPEVEEAAMDLGATRLQAFRLAALPVLWPSIVAAGLLAFVLSFDDFITSFFTSGVGVPPLPVRIYGMLKFGVTPVVNAIGVLMLLATALAVGLALLLTAQVRRLRSNQFEEAAHG